MYTYVSWNNPSTSSITLPRFLFCNHRADPIPLHLKQPVHQKSGLHNGLPARSNLERYVFGNPTRN